MIDDKWDKVKPSLPPAPAKTEWYKVTKVNPTKKGA